GANPKSASTLTVGSDCRATPAGKKQIGKTAAALFRVPPPTYNGVELLVLDRFFPYPCLRGASMPKDSSFTDLVARLRAGDQTAAAVVVDQSACRLIGLARNPLDRRILSKEDPEDVLQSVFKSFFHRCRQGQFRLDSREALWALLVSLTLHKCGHRASYYRAGRRNVQREVHQLCSFDSSAREPEALARDPTPEEAA